ncbi:transposase [Streptomyces sp. LN245]|uniref:transposase n=1 Tax=Streptomyces sp. LN245 TaxID=3112975 RepID=UPI0037200BD9
MVQHVRPTSTSLVRTARLEPKPWGTSRCHPIVRQTPRRGAEASDRLGRHRWVVERTMSWLNGCRRLHRRYERKAEHFLAFAGIASALICYRRLIQ